MHEIITLQFGQQANYLGTHYWNTQESYFTYGTDEESPVDHDRSFRQGIGADGADTYTPRALIYDLKGAFGTLRRENELYSLQHRPDPTQQNAWGRDALALRLPPIVESPYQQALNAGTVLPLLTKDTVRFWSDYNHVYYHPRSLIQLNEYEVNSSLMPFERFDTGGELFDNLDREHDVLDRDLRPFLEECDQLQGIQILSSTTDAWSGFASRYIERIADELGKGSRWLFSQEQHQIQSRQAQLLRLANVSRTINATHGCLSLYIPVAESPRALPPYLNYNPPSLWHQGALHAALVDTLTLPARLKTDDSAHATFYEIEAILNGDNRRPIAAPSLKFSLEPRQVTGEEQDTRMTNGLTYDIPPAQDSALDIDLFPGNGVSVRTGQHGSPAQRQRLFASYDVVRDPTVESIKDDWHGEDIRTITLASRLQFPTLSSWPAIIELDTTWDSVWMQAKLTSGEKSSSRLRYLADLARRSLSMDEPEALYDSLSTMAEEYEESMDFGDLESENSDDA